MAFIGGLVAGAVAGFVAAFLVFRNNRKKFAELAELKDPKEIAKKIKEYAR